MKRTLSLWTIGLSFSISACSSQQAGEPMAPPPPPPEPPPEHVPPPPEPEPVAKPEEIGVIIVADVGFKTPESIFHDPDQDVYFVSNVNGEPSKKDDNGFIMKVSPDGALVTKFIDAADPKIELHAPKGLVVAGGVLYVTDIDRVRMFDSRTGAPRGEIAIPGSTFVNDIPDGPDGSLYVSDSGLKPDFSPSGTDAIFKITNGTLRKLTTEKALGNPNGVLPDVGGVWAVTFASGEIYWVTDKGKRESVQKIPGGKDDGIVRLKDGRICVSSWETSSIYCRAGQEEFVQVVTGVESPADIGYDSTRDRLLIPLFTKDKIVLHNLGPATAAASTTAPGAKPAQ